ncbi:MAG: ribonuclease P protein component [Burkholderiaceae bacterium]|jgi:ribonuclease P protein component|nr:ribonuclease P protein component [Burkholderiaceae bacterium]
MTHATRVRHLRTRAQFQVLLGTRAVARTAHFALHRLTAPTQTPDGASLFAPAGTVWLGAMTPKRWARRAVTRNAIRRQVYAVAQNLMPVLSTGAHLVRLRSAFAPAQFPSARSDALKRAVRAELLQLFAPGGIA